MAEAARKLSLASWAWVVFAALAAFELLADPVIRAAIPREEAWRQASAFVRERFEPNDRIVAAPAWVDPIVRGELGDLTELRIAALPDRAGVGRVWELGIRGATTFDAAPALERNFAGVRVRMWPVESPKIIYDFVTRIREAEVEIDTDAGPLACAWTRGRAAPGGLERGPMMPAERFVCDRARPWLWVGPTILADLELQPRRCIWQHPAGPDAVRTTFIDVPLGERLVVRGGIDYQVARRRSHAPVTLRVWIDDEIAAELVHHDGDGWSGLDIDTSAHRGSDASVRFETTTSDPYARLFCFAASTQTEAPRD
ncbi:MAG: hypothetical protein JRE81_10400 [Deltaproteobacteria bacterium]|nr:hypothetical protein [Deltaproteobacteria bacterium]